MITPYIRVYVLWDLVSHKYFSWEIAICNKRQFLSQVKLSHWSKRVGALTIDKPLAALPSENQFDVKSTWNIFFLSTVEVFLASSKILKDQKISVRSPLLKLQKSLKYYHVEILNSGLLTTYTDYPPKQKIRRAVSLKDGQKCRTDTTVCW